MKTGFQAGFCDLQHTFLRKTVTISKERNSQKMKRKKEKILSTLIAAAISTGTTIAPPQTMRGGISSVVSLYAESNTDNLTYEIHGSEVTIIGSDVSASVIEIPEKIDGCPVTAIEERAFENFIYLTDISSPSTVNTIGEYAFSGCSALTSVAIPYGVKYISDNLFDGCHKLSSVSIPDTVTYIGYYAFF